MTEKRNKQKMSKTNNKHYVLLTEEQVFGSQPIALIEAIGTKASLTDYAVISGAEKRWFLSTAAGYGDVIIVNGDGERGVAYSSARGSVRPAVLCTDISALECETAKGISGFTETEWGEYPQKAVDKALARTLESEYASGGLLKTGKTYSTAGKEFEYDRRKFVRADCTAIGSNLLSNGKTYETGDKVWIEVLPVKWLYDENAGLLLSRDILVSSIAFSNENYYEGDFESTEICTFLNTRFANDSIPSRLRKMTPEEKAAYEEERKRAAQRRNPYGLKFGKVTEEDIIRGAIESDVAVFLHGPSSEGKSARVKQIDPTCEIIYLRNATPDSLNGRSVYHQETGEMIDIPPTWYKKVKAKCEKEPDRFHVVFFDEINNALPSIQGMAFNIVLDREVNGLWKLPDNARVVAAGNDMQDSLLLGNFRQHLVAQ